jgi:hypothetical protein
MEVMGPFHSPAPLSPWQELRVTYWMGDSLGTRTGLDVVVQSLTVIEPRSSSWYTIHCRMSCLGLSYFQYFFKIMWVTIKIFPLENNVTCRIFPLVNFLKF